VACQVLALDMEITEDTLCVASKYARRWVLKDALQSVPYVCFSSQFRFHAPPSCRGKPRRPNEFEALPHPRKGRKSDILCFLDRRVFRDEFLKFIPVCLFEVESRSTKVTVANGGERKRAADGEVV